MTDAKMPASLDEIRDLLHHLPAGDEAAVAAVAAREQQLTKPQGSLGRLEEMTQWLARWQGTATPRLDHPRTAVFAGNHGVCARAPTTDAYLMPANIRVILNRR